MFSNKLHPFIAEKQKKQGVFVSGKNENLDPRSVHSSVIGHACHAAAEASLSVLFVPVTSGSGWMKPGAQEARRLRWGVYFVSHSWFYFSTTGGRLIEELGRRGEGGGLISLREARDAHHLGFCSQFMKEAFAAVRRSGALTERMERIICLCILQSCSALTIRVSDQENPRKKRKRLRNGWIRACLLRAKYQ